MKSLALRRTRARIKAGLRTIPDDICLAWRMHEAQGMKVYDLLTALPGIGKAKALALLEQAGIPEKNTVRACGPKQTQKLFEALSK